MLASQTALLWLEVLPGMLPALQGASKRFIGTLRLIIGVSRFVLSSTRLVASSSRCFQCFLWCSKVFPNLSQSLPWFSCTSHWRSQLFLYQSLELSITMKASRNALLRSDTLLKLMHLSLHSMSSQTLLEAPSDWNTFCWWRSSWRWLSSSISASGITARVVRSAGNATACRDSILSGISVTCNWLVVSFFAGMLFLIVHATCSYASRWLHYEIPWLTCIELMMSDTRGRLHICMRPGFRTHGTIWLYMSMWWFKWVVYENDYRRLCQRDFESII